MTCGTGSREKPSLKRRIGQVEAQKLAAAPQQSVLGGEVGLLPT
jgi:hypothetical protein